MRTTKAIRILPFLTTCAGAAVALGSGWADAASAPKIKLDAPCYHEGRQAAVRATGFTPSAKWHATLDGSSYGSGMVDAAGVIAATFGVPRHLRSGSAGEDFHELGLTDSTHSATARFLLTKLAASFSPSSGDPTNLKVRFHLLGWGAHKVIYVHYVTPKHHLRQDRYLGPSQGSCGHRTTRSAKLFTFTPYRGTWSLQFDTHRGYSRATVPRVVARYRIS